MRAKRLHPRFRLHLPITAAVQVAGGQIFLGELQNLSLGGFRLVSPERFFGNIPADAAAVGEFWVDGAMFQYPGSIRYSDHLPGGGVSFGFSFATGADARKLRNLLQSMIEANQVCAVHLDKERRHGSVIGHLSSGTAKDLFPLINSRAMDILDMSRCHQVDGAGIGLALLVKERGGHIRGCQEQVANLMEIAGACCNCTAGCRRACKAA